MNTEILTWALENVDDAAANAKEVCDTYLTCLTTRVQNGEGDSEVAGMARMFALASNWKKALFAAQNCRDNAVNAKRAGSIEQVVAAAQGLIETVERARECEQALIREQRR